MTQVGLLRHGQVQGIECFRGSTDTPLSPEGYSQMWQTLESNHQWDKIISSPLARCREFAQRYAEQQALELQFDADFQEIDFGAWEGQSSKAIYAADPGALSRFWQDPLKHHPPQGEALLDFQTRVLHAWQRMIGNHAGKRTLLITHAGVIRVIRCYLSQHPLKQLLQLQVPYASLHLVELSKQHAAIERHESNTPV